MVTAFTSVDDYLASLPEAVRLRLQEVRETLHAAIPGAQETISYNIPTLTVGGRRVIHFAGWKHHVSLYPVPEGDAAYATAIGPYVGGKGTVKFPLSEPLPVDLVTRTAQLQVGEAL